MAELIAWVHVSDSEGVPHAFGPGDVVPEWAVKAITNPKVWAPEPEPEDEEKPKHPARTRKS